jgi:5'(3')-deoxyribonucleotidase
MQCAKLFAYVNNIQDDIKCILQNKQFHRQLKVKSEQKEIIQNVLERKDSMAVLPTGFGNTMCYILPLFWIRSDHICKSSPMIHYGNPSFLEVT